MKHIRTILYGAAGLIVFYIDAQIPLGFGIWLAYVFLLFLFVRNAWRNQIVIMTVFYILLILTGYFLSPPAAAVSFIPIINRAGGAILLIFFALLAYNEKKTKRDKAEILERINELYMLIDKNFNLKFINNSAKKYNSLDGEIKGVNYFEAFPKTKDSIFEEKIKESLYKQRNISFEGELPGENKFLDVSLYPSEEGLSIFARDITHRVISERHLKKLLKEKEVLLQEIHHRTKNNFQLMLSLLNLQISKMDNDTIIRILNETRTRILSLTLLHDKLHVQGNIYNVNMKTLIEDIVVKMDTAANFGLVKIRHQLEIDDIKLKMDTAIPVGLIINELYTNSLKYAFTDKDDCLVTIKLYFEKDDNLVVYYKDNGKGFPKGFNLNNSEGLGSSIILSFVEQLNAGITYKNGDGVEFVIRFKIEQEEEDENFLSGDGQSGTSADKV